jgi:hypothetical protein
MSTLRTNNITDTSGGSSSLQIGGGPPARIAQATAQASTSGTAIDFTGIPSWVKRVTVMFRNVSTNGSSNFLVQLGAGSVTTTGYDSIAFSISATASTSTAGLIQTYSVNSGYNYYGTCTISLQTTNTWVSTGTIALTAGLMHFSSGSSVLGGTLDRVRITTVNGTDTFDAGSINIMYEG